VRKSVGATIGATTWTSELGGRSPLQVWPLFRCPMDWLFTQTSTPIQNPLHRIWVQLAFAAPENRRQAANANTIFFTVVSPNRGRSNSHVTRGHLGPSEEFFSVNTKDFESAPLFACRKTRRKRRRFCVRLLQHETPTESRGCVRIAKLTTFATYGLGGRYGLLR